MSLPDRGQVGVEAADLLKRVLRVRHLGAREWHCGGPRRSAATRVGKGAPAPRLCFAPELEHFARPEVINGPGPVLTATFASFLLALSALFSIVNPLGGALIYSQVTAQRPRHERVQLAWRVAVYSGIVMLTALIAGAPLLSFFGISLSALRIAGGLVVAAHAWELLSVPENQEDRKTQQAAPAGSMDDVAFFPLTLPFTTGPGTIAVAIALSASGPPLGAGPLAFYIGASLAAVVIALTVGVSYAFGRQGGGVPGPGAVPRGDAAGCVPAALRRRADPGHGRA